MNGSITRLLIALALCGCGLAVFVLGSPYFDIAPTNGSILYGCILLAVFGIAAIALRRAKPASFPCAWKAAHAFFLASAASTLLTTGLFNLPRTAEMSPVMDLAVDKFSQLLHVVPVILVFSLAAGIRCRELFIEKGRLHRSLLFGGVSFVLFTGVALLTQPDLGSAISRIPAALPWMLVFVFSNALMEELWFRGIFLRPLEPLVGRWGAILVTSFIFGAAHYNATWSFPGGPIVLSAVTFALGVLGAWAMLKYRSLMGPVLLHAGYDVIIIMAVLSSS